MVGHLHIPHFGNLVIPPLEGVEVAPLQDLTISLGRFLQANAEGNLVSPPEYCGIFDKDRGGRPSRSLSLPLFQGGRSIGSTSSKQFLWPFSSVFLSFTLASSEYPILLLIATGSNIAFHKGLYKNNFVMFFIFFDILYDCRSGTNRYECLLIILLKRS